MTLLLGLDVGTTSVKAGLSTRRGRRLAAALANTASTTRFRTEPNSTRTYWSASVAAYGGLEEADAPTGGSSPRSP